MSKPINVEAQRVWKILDELLEKVNVVALLSSEFFQSIITQDVDLEDAFGRDLADLLVSHAELEKSFKENNITPESKIMPLDDEQMTDEHRTTAEMLRKTTSKLIRVFLKDQEIQLKLRRFGDHKNSDMEEFKSIIKQLKLLWMKKLSTSLEEQVSKDNKIEELTKKNSKEKDRLAKIKSNFDEFTQSTNERREQLENQKNKLSTEHHMESNVKERRKEAIIKSTSDKKVDNEKKHKEKMTRLNEERDRLADTLLKLRQENQKEEEKLRKNFERAESGLESNIEMYDIEMRDKTDALNKIQEDYSKVKEELVMIENLYR